MGIELSQRLSSGIKVPGKLQVWGRRGEWAKAGEVFENISAMENINSVKPQYQEIFPYPFLPTRKERESEKEMACLETGNRIWKSWKDEEKMLCECIGNSW